MTQEGVPELMLLWLYPVDRLKVLQVIAEDMTKALQYLALRSNPRAIGDSLRSFKSRSNKKAKEAEVKTEANNEATLRAKRIDFRRLFTVAANSFDDIHRCMNSEKYIDIQFSKVCEKAERLFKVDQKIEEIINFTDEEYDTMESCRDRFTKIRVVYEKNYSKHDEKKSEMSNIRKENPISPKDNLNNAKKKTSWITSELTNEDIQKARLAVLGIVRIEQLSQLKEKIQRHFSSPSERHDMMDAHFIQDTRGTEVHDLDIIDAKYLLERVRYLPNITKRLNWPLGRVIELHPGKEGNERVSKLRVANGFAVRPLQRLYPLEMSVSDLPSDIALGEIFPEPIWNLTD
ncbi:transposable element Tc1 transposase [Trichonephila clavipes]|uniref:Transposable element Tc1 transposase n=1 Tax=Trichonephila clavipes TaxID=2585209 RepID=A0A8X6SP02_TRICX|nr:transposable element Tc1 transposase [Trichonephila clavipes]